MRAYLSIALVLIVFSLAGHCFADTRTGLVGQWKLDEGSGLTAYDASGGGNNGDLTGHAPTWVTGRKNGALSFNGTSSKYVSIGSSFGLSNSNITIAAWCYRAALGDHGAVFKIGNNTHGTGGDGFAIGIGSSFFESSGNNIIALYEGVRWIDSGVTATTGWHHFVLVINASGYPTIYWDGVSIYSDTGAAPNVIGSLGASITQIGGYTSAASDNRFFNGYVDDVRIYNRALSAADVLQLYTLGKFVFNKGKLGKLKVNF